MKKIRMIFSFVIFLCLLLNLSNISLAGNGDGSGGNSGVPLTLSSSTITNGQKGVTLKPQVKLTFSKNVVNMTVKDANQKCFSLQTIKGKSVSLQIIMADDQIEFEKRNDIIIIPSRNLLPGTSYILKIAPELQSKSGVKLGQEIQITFKTLGATPTVGKSTPSTGTTKSVAHKNTVSLKKSVDKKTKNSLGKETKKDITTGKGLETKSNIITNASLEKVSEKVSPQKTPSKAKISNNKASKLKINKVGKVLIPVAILIILLGIAIYAKYKKGYH